MNIVHKITPLENILYSLRLHMSEWHNDVTDVITQTSRLKYQINYDTSYISQRTKNKKKYYLKNLKKFRFFPDQFPALSAN